MFIFETFFKDFRLLNVKMSQELKLIKKITETTTKSIIPNSTKIIRNHFHKLITTLLSSSESYLACLPLLWAFIVISKTFINS